MNDELPTVYYPLSVLDSMLLEQHRCEDDIVALAVARAVAEERAAVVAFLREGDTVCMECGDRATLDLAYCIELGEHRREEER